MNEIEMVIFDMAGTTVKDEQEVEKCFKKAAKASNLPCTDKDILGMMGWSKRLVFETLWERALPKANSTTLRQYVDISYNLFTEILEKHYRTSTISPTTGCLELFEWLKQHNIKIALTTGFYRKVTNIILHKLGWDIGLNEYYTGNGLINISICSDEVKKGRPAPDMIHKCMKQLNITNPRKVINIGDTPSDLESGKKANCLRSLGVVNGTHTRQQLSKCDNDGLLNNILEIKNVIEQLQLVS